MAPPFHQFSLFDDHSEAFQRSESGAPSKAPPRCQVCGETERLNARICVVCQELFGRRDAELLARARFELDFAVEAYRSMTPGGQARFRALLGDPTARAAWKPAPVRLQRPEADSAGADYDGPSVAKSRRAVHPTPLAKCNEPRPRAGLRRAE